jgi:catechol 2,3-dioxygenase
MLNSANKTRPFGVVPPGFQLPDATRLGTVHLQVSDLPRSVDYYQRVLGLHSEAIADNAAVLTTVADNRPLLTLRSRPGVTGARRGSFGLFHFAILLPGRADLGRFAAHLASEDLPVGKADHHVSEALYLRDPDDLGIEVYADRPRATWHYRDRELRMTTEGLDLRDLIDAGAGKKWDGLPTNTTMGHVHLHVGDLGEAEAFYHRAIGFDKTVWSYPGALFLSAGGYHHHLGTNVWSPGPAPTADQAQLLAWDLIVPSPDDVSRAARSLRDAGYQFDESRNDLTVADPWGTRLRVRVPAWSVFS